MKNISPTTALGWLKFAFATGILGHILWTLFVHPDSDALKNGVIWLTVWGIGNSLISAAAGHYTADADATPPATKTTDPTPSNSPAAKAGLILFLAGLLALGSACAHKQAVSTTSTPTGQPAKTVQQTVADVAAQVAPPSAVVSTTIREKVAAIVKKEVQLHPHISAWCDELAKVCYRFSTVHLPSASTLKAGFYVAEVFAPASVTSAIKPTADSLLAAYASDYAAAQAVQKAGTPYLTLFGQGIQDGIAQAAVDEAP